MLSVNMFSAVSDISKQSKCAFLEDRPALHLCL